MNNHRTPENGQATNRFQDGRPNVPPESSVDNDQDRPFRRITRSDTTERIRFQPGSGFSQGTGQSGIDRMDNEGGMNYSRWTGEQRQETNRAENDSHRGGERQQQPERRDQRGGQRYDHDPRAGERSGGLKWWQSETLTVADVMTKNVKSVDSEAGVREIAEIMRQEDVGVVPVVRADGRLFGLVTDRDIVVRGLVPGKSLDECRAKDVATRDIEVASTHDSLSDIIDLMGRQQVRRVPVVDDSDRLVGIVSLGDIANRADYDDELQRAFEKISGRRSFWSRIWR